MERLVGMAKEYGIGCSVAFSQAEPLHLRSRVTSSPSRKAAVSRDYEPVPGQWYQNVEEEESFRVLSVDEDSELIEIEYLDGDIEELDVEAWHEMDLEKTEEPEGWSEAEEEEDEEEEDEDDDDWDEDDDDDDDDEDDEEEEEEGDQY